MKHRLAFAGFRHPHILALWDRAEKHPDCEIVAAWENDAQTREELQRAGKVRLTHDDFAAMLAGSNCSIVAIGDVYARRGALAIAALKAGKHILSDKPLCTTLAELEEISCLARTNGLSVGCQLDLIESGAMRQLRKVIREGEIGKVCTITATAQHPLMWGSRASWYFEHGMHGGTINDIGIHFFDLVPWLVGSRWKTLLSARAWNAKAVNAPHFKDCAQFFALLESGVSCYADLSYLAPNQVGYGLPQFWRVTVHGVRGMAEAGHTLPHVTVATDEDSQPRELPLLTDTPPGYLNDFLAEISGEARGEGLASRRILDIARQTLLVQEAAEKEGSGRVDISLDSRS